MSKVKTKIAIEDVFLFLKNTQEETPRNLTFIDGGEASQAFSFENSTGNFVIRINASSNGFEKDKYAYNNFQNNSIPIPKIISVGLFNEQYQYAISEKSEGSVLKDVTDNEYKEILPELFKILTSIHKIDVSNTSGFGSWSVKESAEADTWKEYVLSVQEYATDTLFNNSFLEKDVWDTYFSKIKELVSFCPEERYLLHGDYGSDNVVTNNGNITGVLDWADSKYGDFLFDIAWLNFWNPNRNPMSFFEDYYANEEPTENFTERVLCYQLLIGLGSLSFYAYSNQKEKYESSKKKLSSLIKK